MTRFCPIWLLVLCYGLAAAANAAVPSSDDSSPPTAEERAQGYRNGRVLVKLREGVSVDADSNRQEVESRHGVHQRRIFRYLERQQMLEFDGSRDVAATVKELRASGLYEIV